MTSPATATRVQELAAIGQSLWIDYIRRSYVDGGGMQALIDAGVVGVTSNPSIFEKAIGAGEEYDAQLRELVKSGADVPAIYEAAVLHDIAAAADLFRPVYDRTEGLDGYVSIEVSPTLAHDTEGTIAEARHLFATLKRPNVMIKVPATPAGIPAIETLTREGINVNITLIFSSAQYLPVAEAYIAGLEKRLAAGEDISRVASVASFFVSRVDTLVDKRLEQAGKRDLLGKAAVANAQVAYEHFLRIFSGPRWGALATRGARVQRPLWASTGTKNEAYSDTLYIDTLVAPDTVNTLPVASLEAFQDHGSTVPALVKAIPAARETLAALLAAGIDVDGEVADTLQHDGVKLFVNAFSGLMATIASKRAAILTGWQRDDKALGSSSETIAAALKAANEAKLMARIWDGDHTVWKPEPGEISNRLAWLRVIDELAADVPTIEAFVASVREAGYTHALLLGMGGSSLAPEVFRKAFGVAPGYLDLAVLDSTHPDAVRGASEAIDPAKTLFIVSTKSGGTVETFSFFKHFFNLTAAMVGADRAGEHFIAITDPGSALADLAKKHDFRETFLNNPDIGGRYSALSHFGIVPAALVGVDIKRLLSTAQQAAQSHQGDYNAADRPASVLGVAMAELAKAGRDKVTLVLSPAIASFGDWVEQLIAESTGKEGKGITPIVGEALLGPEAYSDDRFFVHVRFGSDVSHDKALEALARAGHPRMTFPLDDVYDLGAQMFTWELATAVAGAQLAINPFDQPNVESAKVLAREMVAAYQAKGSLPELPVTLSEGGVVVSGDVRPTTLNGALREFLSFTEAPGSPHPYLALQAYLAPDAATSVALQSLRTHIQAHYQAATTVGYGPRFLHSTGQLHKGDAGNGLFIQITASPTNDLPIPDEAGSEQSSMSFGALIGAQSLGDRQALIDNGRKVIRFDLGTDVAGGLQRLMAALP
ncbi:hypothetical protein AYO38_00755 [bacterium SCGC AG-212-C10]|nr:hypothetical protein AYO38_00755 [bacterium SCGC AG-212-C10]